MLSEAEVEAILADPSKRIAGDIVWEPDPDHPPAQEFRVRVRSDSGWPLIVQGWRNPVLGKLSYALIYDSAARIVGLDLGYPWHKNSSGEMLPGTHKHRWDEALEDADAYTPLDITAGSAQPVEAWRQFCAETRIIHGGAMAEPQN